MSRIYGGIHFMSDNLDGAVLGGNVANQVLSTQMLPVPEPGSVPEERRPAAEPSATVREQPWASGRHCNQPERWPGSTRANERTSPSGYQAVQQKVR